MSTHQENIRDQFTKQAEAFSAAPQMRNEEALQLLLAFSGATSSDTVLDVACGPGLVACAFAEWVQHVVGIDLVPAMIEKAAALQAQKKLSNVNWRVGDVLPLPFADASFSIVVSRYAFHHHESPQAVLSEMTRVCTPGGQVLLCDVTASADAQAAAAYNRMEKLRDPSHVRALSLAELRSLFEEVGLGAPQMKFYRLEFEVEQVLKGSFPNPGDADKVRRAFADSLGNDCLGLNVRRLRTEIHFSYPIAVLKGQRKT